MRKVLLVLLLLSGCLMQSSLKFESEEEVFVIIGKTTIFFARIENLSEESFKNLTLSSNLEDLVSFERDEIVVLKPKASLKVKIFFKADLNFEESSKRMDLKLILNYQNEEGENMDPLERVVKINVRKPKVLITKVETGLLPSKFSLIERQKKSFWITLENKEEMRLENLYLIFSSEFSDFEIVREGISEREEGFYYFIEDPLNFMDEIRKSFELRASLPHGVEKFTFILKIKLVWIPEDEEIVLDFKEIEVEVSKKGWWNSPI
ncbi:MAG: hypothetical protein ACE5K0_07440 [Candidatus Methanofastidiosia archaeon]